MSRDLGVVFGLENTWNYLSRYVQAGLIVEYVVFQGQVLGWLNIIGTAWVCGKAS